MPDYLSGLAARALGVGSAVRPRPAARFEPQPVDELEPLQPTARPRPPQRTVEQPPSAVPAPVVPEPRYEPAVAKPTRRELEPRTPADEAEPQRTPEHQPSTSPRAAEPIERRHSAR